MNERATDRPYNWFGFWVNFVCGVPFGALIFWRYIGDTFNARGEFDAPMICLMIGFSLIVGVISGGFRDAFWAKLVYLPYSKSLYRSMNE